MRVVFLSLAISDLVSIRSYIAKDNPEAAQQGPKVAKLRNGAI